MGRIIIFFIGIVLVMIYPVIELLNQKVPENKKITGKISLYTIYNGKFKKYDVNLTKKGSFERLDIFKTYYLANNLFISDIKKNEDYSAKKAKYQKPFLYAQYFTYKNKDYILKTIKARYNSNTKVFWGDEFNLTGKTYKAKGKSFVIDKNRNIQATYPVFDLKVKK